MSTDMFCLQSDSDEDEEEEEDMDLFVYCVTCGHEVRQRNAFKHMEKCFVKVCVILYLTISAPESN